jgi:hypothetical protein
MTKTKKLAAQHAKEVERALVVLTRVGLIDWKRGENEATGQLDVRLSNMSAVTVQTGSPMFHINGRDIHPASKALRKCVQTFWTERSEQPETKALAATAGR